MKKILFYFFLILGMTSGFAQQDNLDQIRDQHDETPDDPYVYVDRATMPKGPAYRTQGSGFFTTQVNVDANGDDILGDAGNEPSLAVDPTNNDRIVIGWRQFDNINNNFRQAGYGYSLDGGGTFTFPGPINPGVFRSDPVLDFDSNGNFYYNSLQGTFACDVYKIEDDGVVWDGPYPAFGGDKQWMRIDRSSGIGAGHNYSNWNSNFSTCSPGYFTRSTDAGTTFEACIEIDGDPFWGTLAVNATGDLYISGRSNVGMAVIKSTTAKDAGATITWDSVTAVDLDGEVQAGLPINPQGLIGQAWVDVDLNNDNVYLLSSVQRNSVSDPADVMFAKSTDGGQSFAEGQRINTDDFGNYNWFGTLSVAPDGRIDVVWLDTRDAGGGLNSRLYYTNSTDEGETWRPAKILSESFDPTVGYPSQNKMGDYIDMVSDNDHAHLAWCNTLNGGQDVYYTRITPALLGVSDVSATNFQATLVPNPVNSETIISFRITSEEKTMVIIRDVLGRVVNTLMDTPAVGPQRIAWDGTATNGSFLEAGLYFVEIQSGGKRTTLNALIE